MERGDFSEGTGRVRSPQLGGTLAHLEGQIARLRQQLQRPEDVRNGRT